MCRSNYIHFKGCDEDSPYGPPIMCKEFQTNRAMLEEWEDRTGQVSVGQEPTSCPHYRKAILRELEGDCPSCQQHVLNQRERDACEDARISAARGILQSGLDTSARQTPSGGRENPELRAAIRQFNNYAAIFALAPFHLARYTQEEADVVFGAGRIVHDYTRRYLEVLALAESQNSAVFRPARMSNLEFMGSHRAWHFHTERLNRQEPAAHAAERRNSDPGPPLILQPLTDAERESEQAISDAMDVLQRRPLTHLDHLR